LTVHDYGTGGIWTVIVARSAAEIRENIPDLVVYDYESPPKWMDAKLLADIEKQGIIDIDGPLGTFLNGLIAGKT
jgi:hypothetical protein